MLCASLTCVLAGHGAAPVVLAAWICEGGPLIRRVGLSPLAGGAEVAPTARRRRCDISLARRAQQLGSARRGRQGVIVGPRAGKVVRRMDQIRREVRSWLAHVAGASAGRAACVCV